VLPPGFVVIHDTTGSSHNNFAELPGGQEVVCPLFVVPDSNVEAWHDDADLVDASGQVDDDLATTVVVDNLELADVAVLHHHGQESDDD